MTRTSIPEQPDAERDPDSLSEEAARNTLALNPLIGLRGKDLMDGTATLLKAMVNEPTVAGGQSARSVLRRDRADRRGPIRSRSSRLGDKRFADAGMGKIAAAPSPTASGLSRLGGDRLNSGFIDEAGLGEAEVERARSFVANIFMERGFAHKHALEQSGRGCGSSSTAAERVCGADLELPWRSRGEWSACRRRSTSRASSSGATWATGRQARSSSAMSLLERQFQYAAGQRPRCREAPGDDHAAADQQVLFHGSLSR